MYDHLIDSWCRWYLQKEKEAEEAKLKAEVEDWKAKAAKEAAAKAEAYKTLLKDSKFITPSSTWAGVFKKLGTTPVFRAMGSRAREIFQDHVKQLAREQKEKKGGDSALSHMNASADTIRNRADAVEEGELRDVSRIHLARRSRDDHARGGSHRHKRGHDCEDEDLRFSETKVEAKRGRHK